MERSRRGFTLVEALVAVVFAGLAAAGLVQGFAKLQITEARLIEAERVQRLVQDKMDEVMATQDFNSLEGNFEDRGLEGYNWDAALETTGVENLEQLRITVRTTNAPRVIERSLYTLVYRPPEQSTTTTGARP